MLVVVVVGIHAEAGVEDDPALSHSFSFVVQSHSDGVFLPSPATSRDHGSINHLQCQNSLFFPLLS